METIDLEARLVDPQPAERFEMVGYDADARLPERRRPTRRARSLAALMNYLVFGRWPGER